MLRVDLRVNAVHFGHVPSIKIDHYHSYPTELEDLRPCGAARPGSAFSSEAVADYRPSRLLTLLSPFPWVFGGFFPDFANKVSHFHHHFSLDTLIELVLVAVIATSIVGIYR